MFSAENTDGTDFQGTSGSLVFMAGDSEQCVIVVIKNDQETESDEPLVIMFATGDDVPPLPPLPTPQIIIIDDDMGQKIFYS